MTAPTPNAPAGERCSLRHPGMDVQCGLPKGHHGNHTTEIPDTMPWATHGDGERTEPVETKDLDQWFRELEDDNWGDAVHAIRAALLAARREVEAARSALRGLLAVVDGSPGAAITADAVNAARAALAATPEEKRNV